MTQIKITAPYSQDAEEAVLGAILVNPDAFLGIAAFLTMEDFYLLRHQYIFDAYRRLSERKSVIDFVTVTAELEAMQRLRDVGGASYLLQLVNSIPTSLHAETYGRLVQRAAVRRRMLICADEMKALAMDEELALETVLVEAEKRFLQVKNAGITDTQESFQQLVVRMMGNVEDRMLHPEIAAGTPTGFHDLDDVTSGGLRKGKLYILAARPAMGKTSMLLTVALNAAKLGVHVAIASQEMNRDEITERFAAIETGINLQKISMGRLSDAEWGLFVRACGMIGNLPIMVDDANRLTPMDLRAKCLRWRNDNGLDLLMVDYLQILSSGNFFKPNQRTQEVGYFARELKQLAREFNMPVYAAAQLNRGVEDRQDKRPILSDLRESGEIEQEADVVEFIYRDVVYNEATEFPNRAEIIVAKHRNGPTGTVGLRFERTITRFSDYHAQMIDLSRLGERS